MSAVLFFIAAIGALTGAVGVVLIRNPFYSVLALVFHLISLAALFLLLRAEFVAAAQVIVYAGAVMVLYVFVVAYIGGGDEPLSTGATALKILGPLFALALAVELCIACLGTALKGITEKGAPYVAGFGTPAHIGKLFLTTYLFPFEVASLLLLVAAVGAVVLARRRRGLQAADERWEQHLHIFRALGTGTMAEAAGTRVVGPIEIESDAPDETEVVGGVQVKPEAPIRGSG
ncbi:MAG TPA: NADH-quinone oxidoreductase subunit J [Solirubrobacteraceae bacterium]|nr:NADH-quinone oxidoreductase subunit J [Solirubrobacteraceae bacterium]